MKQRDDFDYEGPPDNHRPNWTAGVYMKPPQPREVVEAEGIREATRLYGRKDWVVYDITSGTDAYTVYLYDAKDEGKQWDRINMPSDIAKKEGFPTRFR